MNSQPKTPYGEAHLYFTRSTLPCIVSTAGVKTPDWVFISFNTTSVGKAT